MGQHRWPAVDELRCTSNGACVQVCPTGCLELQPLPPSPLSEPERGGGGRGGLPVLARPHDCVSCELCVAVCPVEAIRMESRWDSAR